MYDWMKFLENVDVERAFRNLRNLSREFEKAYMIPSHSLFATSSFVKEDNRYKVEFDVAKEANAKNVSIDLEDGVLTVSYSYKNEGCESKFKWSETLPNDVIAETLEANVEDGKLTITAEAHTTEEENTTHVRINRK